MSKVLLCCKFHTYILLLYWNVYWFTMHAVIAFLHCHTFLILTVCSTYGLICYGILIMLSSLSLVKVLTSLPFLLQKTVVSVDLLCSKCRKKVMKLISTVEGINSIVLDPSKNTVTVIGEADPVCIIKKVRKFRSSAQIISIGPPKEEKKDEKKEAILSLPRTCQKCDVWYVVGQDYTPCHILW